MQRAWRNVLSRCLPTLIALVALAVPALAEPGSPKTVSKLFQLGEKSTPTAVAAAKAEYQKAKTAAPDDARLDYVYGLVLANQHRYRDALALLTKHDKKKNNNLDVNALRLRIWLELQDHQDSAALDDMVLLSERLAKADDPAANPARDAARFLGTVLGYLELARPGRVKPDLLNARRGEIVSQLGTRYSDAFDGGRNDVAARIESFRSERKAAQDEAISAAEAEKQEGQAALNEDQAVIAEERKAMQSDAERLREVDRELTLLQQQLARMQADRVQLGARITLLQGQLAYYLTPRNTETVVDQRIPGSDRPTTVTRTTTVDGPTAADFIAMQTLSIALAQANKMAFDVDRRMYAMQERVSKLSGEGEQHADSLAERDAAVQQTAKHAKTLQKKLKRVTANTKVPSTALSPQLTSLSTYASFPYEQEKKRVLSWFEKK